MYLRATLVFGTLFSLGLAVPKPQVVEPVRTAFQFPVNTFFENLAVRSNREVLTSLLNQAQLFVIDPDPANGSPQAISVHEFTDSLGLADVGPGSWNVWSVDMNGVSVQDSKLSGSPNVILIANVASANFLNGITLLSQIEGTFLLSDANASDIYRLNTRGNYEVIINSTLTNSIPKPPIPPAGVDGLHVHNHNNSKTLYLVNAGQGFLARVAINKNGTPAGDIEIVARPLEAPDTYDDFTLDCDGNIYLVTGSGNGIERISIDGAQTIIAGNVNSTAIAEPTSAAFGRGLNDKNIFSQGSAACALNL
ncbi:hypothetical protein V8C35DRAFT_333135 [Trichoderma chlorosporum]